MKKTVWKMLPVEPYDMRGLEEWLSLFLEALDKEVTV